MASLYASSMISQPCLSIGTAPCRRLGARPSQRHGEVAAEFLCEIDRYARMHTALSVQKLGMLVERHDRPVPNVWMNIEPAAAVTPERDELLWRHIVARRS